ncbi:MAG: preprotein translocase subunit YajC [Deltaproteobacteria bacterium]|jgi:preprotein translocase subunit YajC|nr:preprotein translocase subunit YajC [Deltaproteobacteria bacterium]
MLSNISFLASQAYAMAPQQGADGAAQQSGGSTMTIIMMVGFFMILYFFLLRPQKKQQVERQKMLDSIQKGDRIQTVGGLMGVVTAVDQKELTVRIAPEVRVKIARSAVAGIQKTTGESITAPKDASSGGN